MMKFVPCVAKTSWNTPTTLCKSPWRVYGQLIIFSASGFPVIIEFQPATCNLQPTTCKTYLPRIAEKQNVPCQNRRMLGNYSPCQNRRKFLARIAECLEKSCFSYRVVISLAIKICMRPRWNTNRRQPLPWPPQVSKHAYTYIVNASGCAYKRTSKMLLVTDIEVIEGNKTMLGWN